jgi:uncharacterized Zn finger protein
MSRFYGGWAPYVPVAERREQALREVARLLKKGQICEPVILTGRHIASTFWGKAWCDNIESYHDAENRLPRGRSYVRNGSVVDLQSSPGRITATVSGSDLYTITITITAMAAAPWRAICTDCAGGIDSLLELLQGRFSKGVMERLCRQQGGLFPRRSEIRFSCSCPDGASMCKHVAAALYGVGARLDDKPELLFRLRAVDEKELITGIDAALPLGKTGPAAGRVLAADDMSALFGLDMAETEPPAAKQVPPATSGQASSAGKAIVSAPAEAKAKRATARPTSTRTPKQVVTPQAPVARTRVRATPPGGAKIVVKPKAAGTAAATSRPAAARPLPAGKPVPTAARKARSTRK